MNSTHPQDKLTNNEIELLKHLLLMTGREDRFARSPLVDNDQLPSIHAICPQLRSARQDNIPSDAQRDLFNRLLLNLSIMPVSQSFFNTVFPDTDFSADEAIKSRVNLFRALCMLEYGNFRFGYKQLRRDDEQLHRKWNLHFPASDETNERIMERKNRTASEDLVPIEPRELFALGSLESEQINKINQAREVLAEVFKFALGKGVRDFEGVKKFVSRNYKLTTLIAEAGLPGAEELVNYEIKNNLSYQQVLAELLKSCSRIDGNAIDMIRSRGMQNANTYMAMHDLDVYVATSMRAPLHFTTNWAFVNSLFKSQQTNSLNLRYFDPTQTYMESRIQMGLLECLMIKRTHLTVYHAQESDTFGKDCEASVTLAQGKPVVVFVTRLFDRQPYIEGLYRIFDEAATRIHRDHFCSHLRENDLLRKDQFDSLIGDPEKSKADAIEMVLREQVPSILKKLGSDRIEMELIRQGYACPSEQDALEFALEIIIKLERRALTFRDVHPLALQASPMDGVARGVIVTRTVDNTARVVSGLIGHTLEYQIVEEDQNWLLVDAITSSPVRVVTKDPVLTSAFWSEKWGT
jgi:hypothetical protein